MKEANVAFHLPDKGAEVRWGGLRSKCCRVESDTTKMILIAHFLLVGLACLHSVHGEWFVRNLSFLTDEIWSIEMLIVGRLTGNMIIFRCKKEMAPRNLGRSHLKSDLLGLLQHQRLWDQFARQTCYVYTGNEPKQDWAHFYKQQLKTWFRAGPWSLSDGTIYGTKMKTSRNFLVQWPATIYQILDLAFFIAETLQIIQTIEFTPRRYT